MDRYKLNELTIDRMRNALIRRLNDIPHKVAWTLLRKSNIRKLDQIRLFHNSHEGKRCFIVGNGPSLLNTDLSKLKNEVTFGMNRIYLLSEQLGFQPTYYLCVNELVLEQFTNDIQALKIPKFLNWNRRKLFTGNDFGLYFVNLSLAIKDFFGKDPNKLLCGGGTVTYVALQLAYYMGFSEVVLIGVDHNFTDKGIPNTTEVRRSERDANHFSPNYFPKGVRWQLPDLLRSERAYSLAKRAYEESGRRIYDATIDGKCQIFEKIQYEDLFHQ